ncbi:hypothetical protein OEZ86_008000 [Tetradesmus obliquus]|nr:hypothetical protein OEZ86_008000 [Tetradesmus obliquus]
MQQQDRLSALEDVVKSTLQIAAVPQLRDGNSKSAAVVSLQMLSFSLVNEAGLQAAGFNESGELHLYLDKAQQAAAGGEGRQSQGSSSSSRKSGKLKAAFSSLECYIPRHIVDCIVFEVASSGGGSSSSSGGRSSSGGNTTATSSSSNSRRRRRKQRIVEPSAASFDAVPAGAVILWEHSTFRGQFFAAHMCEGEEDDPVRWPALLGLCVEVARLLVPGVTVKQAKDALEKKITQQARAITNSHMRNHEPAKVAKNPNFAKLADVEAATSKWEQSQRSLYLRHLEREQRPAGSSAPAGRVAFPSQLVHDLNELRRSAAASRATSSEGTAPVAARPVDSRITPDGGGSVGSSEQQQRRVSQGPFPAVLPAAAALADAGLAPAEGGMSEEQVKEYAEESFGAALYEAVLAGRQPGDGAMRVQHPTDPGKKTKRLSGKGKGKKGSAAADEGAALAARLKRKTAAAAGKKDAAPKRRKPNRRKAAVSSEDTEEDVGCSEDDAPGDGKAAAEVGSDDDEWRELHEQQQQQQQQQQGVQQAGVGVESDKRPRRSAGLPLRLQE